MEHILISLFAETFIHPGSGQNDGGIDQPVARERVTGYPFIAGSSLKGAWLDYAKQNGYSKDSYNKVFGSPEAAGQLLFSDARIVLLPVRSLSRSYCWVTCPLVLERLQRDLKRMHGSDVLPLDSISVESEKFIGLQEADSTIFLEERYLQRQDTDMKSLLKELKKFIPDPVSRKRLDNQLVIVSNADFDWFAGNGLPVQARNSLDDKTKESKNLWYEETLPPDSLMLTTISQRDSGNSSLEDLKKKITEKPYLQVGGNETVGQGWFQLGIYPASDNPGEGGEQNG